MIKRYLLLAGYIALVLFPAGFVFPSDTDLRYLLARIFALSGASLLLLQLPLAARFKWLERVYGLDKLMRFHLWTGIIGYCLITLHGTMILVYYWQFGWDVVVAFITPGWRWETLGLVSFLFITIIILITFIRRYSPKVPYHVWKWIHQFIYLGVLGGFFHSLFLGTQLTGGLLRWYWIGLGLLALYAFIHRRCIVPYKAKPYRVSDHQVIAKTVHHVILEPTAGAKLQHQPGQFIFVQFQSQGITKEWHPFTVSSAPSAQQLTLSMKTSGDWTQTLDQLAIGSHAKIEGPYGRFSYASIPPDDFGYVFVAGGIGITPLHSMITELLAQSSAKPMTLLYSARSVDDIAFKTEFDALAASHSNFKLVYVTGRIDQACLQKEIPEQLRQQYFICGPKPMMKAIVKCLHNLAVPTKQIHFEEFALN
ncbi:MAG: ferric reductase-like transmembrane domain-containing protein [Candidatus Kerfeldbacteria bacterium]|nr:ferric reductase-like transmembrane domain-containing protein [Candidatus Kerfeldbacteria bacterium]